MQPGVIAQIRAAYSNLAAMVVGCLLGGFIPLATYLVSHREVESVWSLPALLVCGGLLYSAKTVWQWSHMAFQCRYKATGFVLLTEGVMVLSDSQWLAVSALSYLVAINAVATGCALALHDAKQRDKASKKSGRASKPAAPAVDEVSGVRQSPTRARKAA